MQERGATAWVDGNNLLGPVVGNFCMDLAIKKAKEVGVGWVVAKGSNHYGIAGFYALRAMAADCLVGCQGIANLLNCRFRVFHSPTLLLSLTLLDLLFLHWELIP